MLLILDFDVDHILTANRIDDDIQMMNICSQIESEGIQLFVCIVLSSCGWLFKCANCNLIFNIAVCIFLLILEMTMYQIIIFLL